MMVQVVKRRATVQPGGRVEVVAEELPVGAVADVVITIAAPQPPDEARPAEIDVEGMPEIVRWQHHGELRAKLRGTGLEVWEIISAYLDMERDFGRLVVGFNWLSFEQIRAALVYAHAFPDEIAPLVQRNYDALPDELKPDPVPRWP